MGPNRSFASSAPASATFRLIQEFHIDSETSYANVTVYLLGFMSGVCMHGPRLRWNGKSDFQFLLQPVLWGPGSEICGRQTILRATTICFTLFHLGQALGKNIETYLVTRFFCGFFGVAPLTVCGGTFSSSFTQLYGSHHLRYQVSSSISGLFWAEDWPPAYFRRLSSLDL